MPNPLSQFHFQFLYPLVLLLLPLLWGYFVALNRYTVTDMSQGRRRLALAVRCLLVTLLIFVLAGFRWVKKGDSLAVIFVVDGSKSIRDAQRAEIQKYLSEAGRGMHGLDKVGVITFASEPHTQSSPGQPLDAARLRDPGQTTATDIAQALRQAKSELDTAARDSAKRIVLLSDGNENAGRALAEVPELAAGEVTLDTVTLPTGLDKEALIEKMVVPSRVKIGEPFPVRVVVSSLTPQSGVVSLTRDGKPTGIAKKVELHSGKNVVVFDQNIDKPGFFRYGATLDAPQDTIPENNKGESYVWVRGKPTILYVADDPSLTGFLQKALQSQNIEVNYAPPAALPTTIAALQRFDSIFLSNVAASDFTLAQMNALQSACRDFGVGFGMVGGVRSFGAGGWLHTPVEDVLPVSMEVKKQKRLPSVAVALVIEDLEIPTSVNMSKEAAKATMDLLEPIDQVGVLDCQQFGGMMSGMGGGASTAPAGTWRIPMQHVVDREAIKAQMQGLENMGDPPSYQPFLMEAARKLNETDAKVKHIIFLGDGDAVFEGSQNSIATDIKKIRDMGITLSTITTGAMGQQDVKFMATLAFLGGGQNYVAEKPQDLPRLLLKDQQTISQPPIIEEPFRARPVEGDEILTGIGWNSAPPLLGYNIGNVKATASESLRSHRNDPVFAGWRYGLGRSVAFMSDDRAKWGAQWIGWSGYAKFWAQVVRWTLRPVAPSDYSTQVVMDGGRGHVIVDALDKQDRYINKLALRARVATPALLTTEKAAPLETPLRQTGPGHYEAWFDAPQIGTYLVNVLENRPGGGDPNSSTVIGLSTAYSPEYKDTQPNRYLMTQLAQIGQGHSDVPSKGVFSGERPGKLSPNDMTVPLLLAAILFLPFDIAVRRLALDRSDWRRALVWIRSRTGKAPKARTATPELGRLLDRKEAVVAARTSATLDGVGETSPLASAVSVANSGASASPVAPSATTLGAIPTANRETAILTENVQRSPSAPRATRPTLRPDGMNEAANAPAVPEPASTPGASSQPEEEAGMSRLMAAKRRAQQRQEGKEDENSTRG